MVADKPGRDGRHKPANERKQSGGDSERKQADDPRYLAVEGVARRYGTSTQSIRRWADCGLMPRPSKFSTCCRWSIAVLDQWDADGNPRCDRGRAAR
jgi:hypothetical protein